MSFCCLPLPNPSLSCSPSDFLDNPYLTFPIHILSLLSETRKVFWGFFWSRTFSCIHYPGGIKKKLTLKIPLLTSITQSEEGAKLPLLLQVPLSLLILLIKQRPHFPKRTIQDLYQLICPWYESQFEHYLVYILAIKLWLQTRKMIVFWHRMAMIFLRLQKKKKLIKLCLLCLFSETAKLVHFAHAIKNN